MTTALSFKRLSPDKRNIFELFFVLYLLRGVMMKHRFAVYILVVLFLLPIAPQAHAITAWSAWLYQEVSGTMTLVNQDGATLDTFILPSEANYTYSRNIAVSDSGNLFAYVVSDTVAPNNGFLYIYDRAADTVRYAFDMGPTPTHSLDFTASNLNFSADDSIFAFGYSNSDNTRWWALVIDLTTFDVPFGVRSTDPLAVSNGLQPDFLLPVVQYNRDGQVVLTPVLLGTEGLSEYNSFTWDTATTSLTPNPVYRTLQNDTFLPTGEVIMAAEDDRLPLTSEDFAYFQYNTLQVYDPALGGRYPFYHDAEMFYYDIHFIQGGARVLASSGGSGADSAFYMSVIDRSGALVGYFPSVDFTSLKGVLDGFIFTTNFLNDEGIPQLLYVNTSDGVDAAEAGIPIWTGTISGDPVQVVWTSDMLTPSTTPFTPWARLADPIVPSNTTQPVAISVTSDLTVGETAVVSTTGGDQLNVRSGAGTGFEVLVRLDAGAIVTLLEGPVDNEGFTWWRIRTDTGVEGWVVDSVDDGGTRIQTLVPR
jgi:hypothetical protein